MADIKCVVTTADSKGNSKKFEITQNHFFIGRADNCDVSLAVKGISRQHLEINIRDGLIFVKDLNSSNGTRINGASLTGGVETLYKPGDEVWLGPMESAITFSVPTATASNQAPTKSAVPISVKNPPTAPPSPTAAPTPTSIPPATSANHSVQPTTTQTGAQSGLTPPPIVSSNTASSIKMPPRPLQTPFAVPVPSSTAHASRAATPPAIAPVVSAVAGRSGIQMPPPLPRNIPSPASAPSASFQSPNSGTHSGIYQQNDHASGLYNGSAAVAMNHETSVIRDTPSIIRENGTLNRDSEARLKQVQEQAGYILQEAKIKADNLISQAKLEARNEAARVEQDAHRMFAESEDHANEVRKTAELEAEQILQITHKKSLNLLDEANQNATQIQNKIRAEIAQLKKESERQSESMISAAREQARELRGKIQTEYDEVLSSARKKAEEDYQRLITTAKDEAALIKSKNDSLYKENKILEEKRQDLESKAQAIAQAVVVREKDLREISNQFDEKKKSTVEFDSNFAKAKSEFQSLNKQSEDAKTRLDKLALQIKDFESRKNDYESFADKELASARAHQKEELQKKRDQILIDHDKLKTDLEKDLAESRRREMDKIQSLRQEEIKMMRERRHVHAVELARAIEMFLRPVMTEALGSTPTPPALQGLDRTLEPLIRRVLGGEETDRSGSTAERILTASAEERDKKRWQHIRRGLICVAFLALVLIGFFKPIWFSELAKRISGDEQRNEYFKPKDKARYNPAKDDIYRISYTENLLYLKDYAKYKVDVEARKHWILSLNNLFIQDLGLNENLAVNFVGQESAMTDTLLQELEMIDPSFLKIGLDRMNRSEFDSIQNIRKIVVKEQDWRRIRELDHEMYREWLHR